MAKKYVVNINAGRREIFLTVDTLVQATGLATTNLLKGRSVTLSPAAPDAIASFRTTAAAQAHVEVALFELTAVNEGDS